MDKDSISRKYVSARLMEIIKTIKKYDKEHMIIEEESPLVTILSLKQFIDSLPCNDELYKTEVDCSDCEYCKKNYCSNIAAEFCWFKPHSPAPLISKPLFAARTIKINKELTKEK
jgi:hypothetical protein